MAQSLMGSKNCLITSGDDALTMEIMCKKLNHQYKNINNKKEEKTEREGPYEPITNNISIVLVWS